MSCWEPEAEAGKPFKKLWQQKKWEMMLTLTRVSAVEIKKVGESHIIQVKPEDSERREMRNSF